MTKAESIALLKKAIKTYAEKLFENENRETPLTTSVNFLTQLYEAPAKPANLAVTNINIIGTIGASIAITLRDLAEAKRIKYSEAISTFLDRFEFSTDVLDAFTDNLFSLSSIIGRQLPGNLTGWQPYLFSVGVIAISLITGILTTKALSTLDERDEKALYASSRQQKVAMILSSAYEGFNNVAGTISAVEIAFAFISKKPIQQRADNVINYVQLIGGGIYGTFKGAITTAQMVERFEHYQLSDEKRERLDKIVERVSNVGYIGYKGALYYTLYQSGYLPYIVAAIAAKGVSAAVNTKISFWAKNNEGEGLKLLEEGRSTHEAINDDEMINSTSANEQRSRCTLV